MDRRKTPNSNFQSNRKRRRKLSSSNENDQQSDTDLNASQTTNSGNIHAHQWNVIDRVLDANKYDNAGQSSSSLGLYELCRDWIYAGTTLAETIRLVENSVQEKAKMIALNVPQEEDHSSQDEKKSNEFITKLPDPVEAVIEINSNSTIEKLNKRLEKIRQTQANDIDIVKSLNVDDQVIQAHALLKLHVNRWKIARKEWNSLYKQTNVRYSETENILKSIFEEFQ